MKIHPSPSVRRRKWLAFFSRSHHCHGRANRCHFSSLRIVDWPSLHRLLREVALGKAVRRSRMKKVPLEAARLAMVTTTRSLVMFAAFTGVIHIPPILIVTWDFVLKKVHSQQDWTCSFDDAGITNDWAV
jgi:hypothetical protein